MGTRGAIGFIIDEKHRIVYNHFDSYPEGIGQYVLDYLNSIEDFENLIEQVRKIETIDTKIPPTEKQKAQCSNAGTINLNVSRQSMDDWYCLLREAQGELQKYIEVGMMPDNSNFLLDSLFCEWAYIVNLDEMTFEIYQGFNTDPNALGRYAKLRVVDDSSNDEYYGVKLICELDLFDLPKSIGSGWDEETDEDFFEIKFDQKWKNIKIGI